MSRTFTGFTRREFLVGAAVAGLGAVCPPSLSTANKSLRARAAEKGIIFGSAISVPGVRDLSYSSLLTEQCGITVPENALKWAALRPSEDVFNFKDGDALLEYSRAHDMAYRGHALVWHGGMPRWFAGAANQNNAKAMMERHIDTVVRHYAGKLHSWDVVNEVVEVADGRPDGLRVTPWLQLLGPEYIEMAFRLAYKADPTARLVYNENFLEPDDAPTESKRHTVLSLLTSLRKRNVPIHALGIQSHIYGEAHVTGPNFRQFLDAVSDLGLAIYVTEMDVRDKNLPADVGVRDRLIAEQYYNYLSFVLQSRAVKAVLTWGLTDRYTWLAESHPRPDGLPVRPLPYDSNYQPTPAWDAIRRALDEAPSR